MASGTLGRLSVDLLIETAEWISGLNKSEAEAKKFAENVERRLNKMAGGVADSIKRMAAGVVAGFAVDRIAGFVNEVQKAADSLDELAQSAGTSVEFMAEMSILAEMSGTSIGALSSAMGKFNKATVQAFGDSSSSPAKVFKALNIELKDSEGKLKSSEDLYKEVATALGTMEDGAVKSAAAQILLGKSAAELVPLMNTQARASDEVKAATKAYGDEIKKLVPAAGALEEQQTIMAANSKTMAAILGQELLPYFTTMLKQWNALSASGSGLGDVGTFLLNAFKGVVIAADAVVTTFMNLITIVVAAVRVFGLLQQGKLGEAFKVMGEGIKDVGAQGAAFAERTKAMVAPMDAAAEATKKWKTENDELAKAVKGADKAFGKKYETLKKYKPEMDGVNAAIKKYGELSAEITEQRKLDDAFANVRKEVEQQTAALYMTTAELERYNKRAQLTAAANKNLLVTVEQLNAELDALDDALKQKNIAAFGKSFDEAEKALKEEIKTMGMGRAELERYTRQKLLLAQATQLGIADTDEYRAAVERLNKTLADKEAAQNYLEFLGSIEGAWHDAFNAMFDETEGGWEGMLKSLKASFKKMLLDYIYQAFAKPFALQLTASMTGGSVPGSMLQMSGSNNFLNDLFGGFGGGSGGFMDAISGWFQPRDTANEEIMRSFGGTSTEGGLFGGNYFGNSPMLSNSYGAVGVAGAGIVGGLVGGYGARALGAGERGVAAGQQYGAGLASLGMMVAGPIGAAVGAVVGLAIGKFTDPDPDAMRAAVFGNIAGSKNPTQYQATSAFGTFGLSDTEWFSDSEMGETLKPFIDGMKLMDDAFAGLMTDSQIEETTARIAEFSQRYEFGMEHGAVQLGKITQDRLAIIAKAWSEGLADFVTASEAPVQDLISIVESFARLQSGKDFDFEAAVSSAKPQTMFDAYGEQSEALDAMVDGLDTSAESMVNLTGGMQAFQLSTVQLLMAIDAIAASVHGMFTATADDIAKSVMSPEQRYNFLQAQTDQLYAQLETETDPGKIEEISRRINANINEAWSLLSPEQREAQADEYIRRIGLVDQKVADRLKEIRVDVVDEAETVMEKISTKLDEIFAKGEVSADKNVAAADKIDAAADKMNQPVQVTVNSDGSASVNGG